MSDRAVEGPIERGIAWQKRVWRAPGRLARAVPILEWLPHYRRAWLSRDLIAGVTVWAVLIPESIAYASIAGVPAQYGLYTALGAAAGSPSSRGTRQVITGPSGPIAAVAASVCTLVVAGDTSHYLSAMIAPQLRHRCPSTSCSVCCAWAGCPTSSLLRSWKGSSSPSRAGPDRRSAAQDTRHSRDRWVVLPEARRDAAGPAADGSPHPRRRRDRGHVPAGARASSCPGSLARSSR